MRNSLRGALGLALVLGGVTGLGAQTVASCSLAPVRVLERELAADVVRDSVGSVAAAVFVGDEVVWRGAFGWEDRDRRTLASAGTLYRAGSITKAVTALVLLRLVEEGVIGLDDPVAEHLPEIRGLGSGDSLSPDSLDRESLAAAGAAGPTHGASRAITFRDLATHTAGLAREPEPGRFGRGAFQGWKRRAVAAIPETRVVDPPGVVYRYSNIGYALLGFALERAAGVPYEVLVDSLVFRPLGMIDSRLQLDRDGLRRLATGYVNLPGDTADPRVPRAERRGRGYRVPGEGVFSTVGDLARLGMALTGARPLLPDSLRRLMLVDRGGREQSEGLDAYGAGADRPATDRPDADRLGGGATGYGIGVHLLDLGGAAMAGHSGTVPGYAAFLLVDPARETGVVLLRSYNHGETNLGAAATRLLLEMCETPSGAFPDGASTLRPRADFRSPAGPAGARSHPTRASP
jgi:CubicO group peptidase (beta-lactamase class C family)